jgi:hypothetical protein
MKNLLIAGSLFLAGCATSTYPVAVYQENGGRMSGEFVRNDWSGGGEVWFTQTDGEKFTGYSR